MKNFSRVPLFFVLLLLDATMVAPSDNDSRVDGYGDLSLESNNSETSLDNYMPGVRIQEDMTYEERTAIQLRLNYTTQVSVRGHECTKYDPSTDKFVTWKISHDESVDDLTHNDFECTESQWVENRLNCGDLVGRTCANGRPVVPSVEIFQGGGSCSDLIAAMNIIHGEDPMDDEYICEVTAEDGNYR